MTEPQCRGALEWASRNLAKHFQAAEEGAAPSSLAFCRNRPTAFACRHGDAKAAAAAPMQGPLERASPSLVKHLRNLPRITATTFFRLRTGPPLSDRNILKVVAY